MTASLSRDVSRSRQLWMLLFVAALVVLPTVARSYQTIIKAQTARLGYRSAWVGVTARRTATAPHHATVAPRVPVVSGVDPPPVDAGFRVRSVDHIAFSAPRVRSFDILRGPPSIFLA